MLSCTMQLVGGDSIETGARTPREICAFFELD
jgi:hypothetical protein